MIRSQKVKLAAGVAAAVAVAGGGAAVAATKLTTPKEERQAVLNDAAKKLGVTPTALGDALEQALANRVDAAVADGRLTQEQGNALKERIRAGDLPLFGGPRLGHHRHGFADLATAAAYLGVTEVELRERLEAGKTLADVARDQGKSVSGLVDTLVAAVEKKLDADVAAGRLTQAKQQEILSGLRDRVTDRVEEGAREHGLRSRGFGFRAGAPAGEEGAAITVF